ncbi:MAG: 4-oxalocrotonate tautomerase [Colwellia sp.]|nr:4-oxalocrotonate tautomerase [Colwellia sp.]
MPLTLTLTEGIIPAGFEKEVVSRITDSMLKHHGLLGNSAMTPNITAHVSVLPKSSTFSGGEEFSGVWMEWKVPSFAFASREIQLAHFAEATEIIRELSGGKQPIEHIYSNVIHTVDGSWNFNGVAMTNEEIGEEISKG